MTCQSGATAMKCKHGHGYLQHVHGAAPEDTMPTGGIDAACNNCMEEVRNEEMPSGKQIGHAHSHIHTLGCATDTPAPHSHRNQPFLVLHLPSTSTRQSRKSNISISTMSAILGFCWVLPTDMLQTQAHVGHGFVLRQISAKRPGTSLSMCCGCQSCLKRLGCLFLASVQPLSRGKAQNRGRPSASREHTVGVSAGDIHLVPSPRLSDAAQVHVLVSSLASLRDADTVVLGGFKRLAPGEGRYSVATGGITLEASREQIALTETFGSCFEVRTGGFSHRQLRDGALNALSRLDRVFSKWDVAPFLGGDCTARATILSSTSKSLPCDNCPLEVVFSPPTAAVAGGSRPGLRPTPSSSSACPSSFR